MCCQNLWKKSIPFTLALMLGLSAVNVLRKEEPKVVTSTSTVKVVYSRGGNGTASCNSTYNFAVNGTSERDREPAKITPIKIIAKPRPNYTDVARQSNAQGTITLRVTFLANCTIGSINPVTKLPDGLTEQAIIAAREIKFEPAKKNGVPYTVTKQVQYNFTLY